MPLLHRLRYSHEESVRQKQPEERVWMEALEGRVLLAATARLDLSQSNDIHGSGSATYSFEAQAGRQYLFIDLEYNEIHLYDSDRREIARSRGDLVSRLLWKAPRSGAYSIWIDAGGDDEIDDYDYELIARQWSDDFGNDRSSATLLSEDKPIQGEIEDVDDRDVFEFYSQAGARYAFNAHSDHVGAGVYEQSGRALDYSDGSQPLPYTGIYYIVVEGDGSQLGTYTLSGSQVSDDHPGGAESAAALELGIPMPGSIDWSDDNDWYSFSAKGGTQYTFEADGGGAYVKVKLMPADPAADRGEIPYRDYQGRLEWTAPADGLYLIDVSPMYGCYQTPYVLNAAVAEETDSVPGAAEAQIEAGKTVQSSMQRPGEAQYFPFSAKARATYTVQLQSGTLAEGVVVGVVRADGTVVENMIARTATGEDKYYSVGDRQIRWTAPDDRTYYLWVRGFNPLAEGSYGFTLVEEPDDHGNSMQLATPIALGQAVLGAIQYPASFRDFQNEQDPDWFAFDAVEGEQYVINLDRLGEPKVYGHREMASLNDLYLVLFDANGNPLAGAGGGYLSGGKLEWTAPASGKFYLEASSAMLVKYRVLVTTPENDPDPATVLAAGGTLSGQLGEAGMAQRVRIDVEAGQAYTLNIRGSSEWQMVATDVAYSGLEPIRTPCAAHVLKANEDGSYFVEFYAYHWGARDRYTISFSKYDGPLKGEAGDCRAEKSEDEAADANSQEESDDDEEAVVDGSPMSAADDSQDEESDEEGSDDWLGDDGDVLDSPDNFDWGNI